MKMKRFVAPDIRQALQQVKETLGADAVILSNRKVAEGVEIVAARDFEVETVVPREREPARDKAGVTPRPAFSARSYGAVAGQEKAAPARRADVRKPVFPKVEPADRTKEKASRTQVSETVARPKPGPITEPPPPDNGLASIRRELAQMRRLLHQHLARDAWHEIVRSAPTRLDLLRALGELGFSRSLALELSQRAGGAEEFAPAMARLRQILGEQLPVQADQLLEYGGVVALVGPTGVGKTTTIAKLAARFRLKYGPRPIALVTTDNYRIAAHEQLSTYARILGVPVRVAAGPDELQAIVRSFVDKKLVLIDTAGMSQRDMRLAEQFDLLRASDITIETYLVLSAATQLKSLYETVEAFSRFQPKSCILTKLDEAGALGPVLSVLMERGLPAAFVTDGQRVPEDLHPADAADLVARAFRHMPDPASVDMDLAFEDWIAHANA